MKDGKPDRRLQELRRRAEVASYGLRSPIDRGADLEHLSNESVLRLIHELDVHRIELEMQNEELEQTLRELQKVRDRYSNLYDFAPVGYFTLDLSGKIREANLTGADMLEINRPELIGHFLTDFIAREDQDQFYHLHRQIRVGAEQISCELGMVSVVGNRFDARVDCSSVREQDGRLSEQWVVISDNTERKRMERQRKMFFASAGHELRTPITNVVLALDMLWLGTTGKMPPKVKELVKIALTGASRLKRLVRDILDIQLSENGELAFRLEPLNLIPLLEEAVESNRPYTEQRGIRFLLKVDTTQIQLKADADRLIQVLNNLLSNAARFTCPGDTVEITVARLDGQVRVTVTDHGPGVPEAFQSQIFEPFAQAEPSLEGVGHEESTGLGLTISKAIVEKMGGRMGFESRPNILTRFYFELPELTL